MATKILMPSLGMYTIEGELTRWLVPSGTAVAADQAVLELTTEKSTVEINSPAAGILQHAAAAGDVVLVEALLGYVLAPGEAPPAEDVGGTGPAAAGAGAAAAGDSGAAAPTEVSQAGAGQPAGSGPAAGAVRASPAARKRAKELGVELGWLSGTGPGGRITEADVQMAASSLPATSAVAAAPAAAPAPRAASATERGPAGVAASGGAVRASPAARKRAKELGVELGWLSGTGPGGRITEADVETAANAVPSVGAVAAAPAAPPQGGVTAPGSGPARAAAPAGGVPGAGAPDRPVLRRVPLSGMRRVIAARMHSSLANSAQLTLTREADASPLIAARQAFNAAAGADPDAPKVAFDVLLAKALATALGQQPALNAIIDGDEILLLDGVHVGIAVAVEDGLLVPVLRDASNRPVRELAAEFARLAECAREGKLTPPEYEGGTVTITNLGGYGIDTFTPILNPPESAILGVGRIAPRPFVASADGAGDTGGVGDTGGGAVTVRPTVHLSLTFDHRVADGAAAAQLLDALIAQWPRLAAAS